MYHYTDCGLRNIYLRNGFVEHETPYGKGVSVEDVAGLHEAIAMQLTKKPAKLTGAEIRFLRKEMEMSQTTLGSVIGVSAQSLASWEKSKGRITAPAERLLRLIVKGHFNGNATIKKAIEVLNNLDVARHESKMFFQETGKRWKSAA